MVKRLLAAALAGCVLLLGAACDEFPRWSGLGTDPESGALEVHLMLCEGERTLQVEILQEDELVWGVVADAPRPLRTLTVGETPPGFVALLATGWEPDRGRTIVVRHTVLHRSGKTGQYEDSFWGGTWPGEGEEIWTGDRAVTPQRFHDLAVSQCTPDRGLVGWARDNPEAAAWWGAGLAGLFGAVVAACVLLDRRDRRRRAQAE